jgi:hypothetical protein
MRIVVPMSIPNTSDPPLLRNTTRADCSMTGAKAGVGPVSATKRPRGMSIHKTHPLDGAFRRIGEAQVYKGQRYLCI